MMLLLVSNLALVVNRRETQLNTKWLSQLQRVRLSLLDVDREIFALRKRGERSQFWLRYLVGVHEPWHEPASLLRDRRCGDRGLRSLEQGATEPPRHASNRRHRRTGLQIIRA